VVMVTADKANRRYFREAYRTGEHFWPAEDPSLEAMRAFKKIARVTPDARLLDVGCGEGRHSLAAAKMGFKVSGIDYEALAIRRARQLARAKGVRGIDYQRASVFKLPFAAAAFDAALDFGCLHHQRKSDWARYRASILRVLAPGGFLVLCVFSPKFELFRGSRRAWQIAGGAYRHYFTKRDLRTLFGEDFEILEIAAQRDGGEFWHVMMRRKNKKTLRR
jgi:SAM-dependent methyltransferase